MSDALETVPGAQPADSPTAPVEQTIDPASFTPEERSTWKLRGTFPDRFGAQPADTPSAQPGDQAASKTPDATGTAAASEPAKPGDKPPRNIQTRTERLKAENAELQEQLRIRHALRQELARFAPPNDATPEGSSPERPTIADWERFRAMPDAPKVENFEHYEDFTAAMSVFIADQRFDERQQARQMQAQESAHRQTLQRMLTAARERLQTHLDTDPDFTSKVHPDLLNFVPAFAVPPGQPIGPDNVVAQELLQSDVQPQLMVHFSTPEGIKELNQLFALPASQLLRAFGRIEARFLSTGPADADKPEPPAPKTVTSAPAPPTTLGRRPAEPADPVHASVIAGDFRAFKAEQNARDVQRAKVG